MELTIKMSHNSYRSDKMEEIKNLGSPMIIQSYKELFFREIKAEMTMLSHQIDLKVEQIKNSSADYLRRYEVYIQRDIAFCNRQLSLLAKEYLKVERY